MKRTISLQSKLIKHSMYSSIFAGTLAWVLLLAMSCYQAMSVQDDLMEEIAEVLLGDVNRSSTYQVDELSHEYDMQYQLIYENEILTSSNHHDLFANTMLQSTNDGFGVLWHNGELLRSYTDQDQDLTVAMLQPLDVRLEDLWGTSFAFGGVLIIVWFLQWGILTYLIKRQLKPLHKISHEIAEKSAQDLSPMSVLSPEIKELQPIVKQLNAMLSRVESSLHAEQRFTADASHELRSPLSAIQMRLQVLQRKYADNENLMMGLQQIQLDVGRGTQVLENLLLLARLDPEQPQELATTLTNIKEKIQSVVQMLRPFAEEKDIQWQIQTQEIWCEVQPELMFSCLRNLIDNAIRYSPQHGLIKIAAQYSNDGNAVRIEIENSGDGLSDETLQRLGERFYRALGTKTQGSGLGLSICKKVIELHQGNIKFSQSTLGGLNVVIEFPKK